MPHTRIQSSTIAMSLGEQNEPNCKYFWYVCVMVLKKQKRKRGENIYDIFLQAKEFLPATIGCCMDSHVHGNKSTPQTGNTIGLDRLDGTINKAIVNLLVSWLIHQIGTKTIKGRYCTGHEKPSSKGSAKGSSDILSLPSGCQMKTETNRESCKMSENFSK